MAKPKEHRTRPKQYDPSKYHPKGPNARATAPQLWRLNRHDGYLARALEKSGGLFVQADVAHELIAFLMRENLPNEHTQL